MSPIIRFLDYFGGVMLAAGAIWLFVLFRNQSLSGALPPSVFQPVMAGVILVIGLFTISVARLLTVYAQMQVRKMRDDRDPDLECGSDPFDQN